MIAVDMPRRPTGDLANPDTMSENDSPTAMSRLNPGVDALARLFEIADCFASCAIMPDAAM